jgi:hypothetical protein
LSWRGNDDYTGWAPLAPRGYEIDAPNWVFVDQRHFLSPQLRNVVVVPSRNEPIFQRAAVLGAVSEEGGRWRNSGVDLRRVERATGTRVEPFRVRDASGPKATRVDSRRREVQVFRPDAQRAVGEAAGKPQPRQPRALESQRNRPQQDAQRQELQRLKKEQGRSAQGNQRAVKEQRGEAQRAAVQQRPQPTRQQPPHERPRAKAPQPSSRERAAREQPPKSDAAGRQPPPQHGRGKHDGGKQADQPAEAPQHQPQGERGAPHGQ